MFDENDPKNHNTPRPTNAGLVLSQALSFGSVGEKNDLFLLFASFEKLFGKHLAEHLKIIDLKDAVLVLKATNSVWRSESEYQKKAIIDRCNGLLGAPRVKSIRFV